MSSKLPTKNDSKNSIKQHSIAKKEPFDPGGMTRPADRERNAPPSVKHSRSLSNDNQVSVKETVPRSQSVNSMSKDSQIHETAWTGNPDISITESPNDPQFNKTKRLVLFSSKIKNNTLLLSAALQGVKTVQYKYESGPTGLDVILKSTRQALAGSKVESVAIIPHTKPGSILLCTNGEKKEVLTPNNVKEQLAIQSFLRSLVEICMDSHCQTARLDFLACSALRSSDIQSLTTALKTIIKVEIGMSKDIIGSDIPLREVEKNSNASSIGGLYFAMDKLQGWSPRPQSLAGFERIRTVGKGAYGAAVLYRKKDDDSLVILKEINMHDLNANERQMALNEIRVLSMLDHPNIISYYDSFEEDGTLMIEMEYADGGTLAEYLSSSQGKRELEEQEILGMFQQMVAGIRHIHEHKILHRDLKTANIFLTKDGIVKIGDFGISKVLSSNNPGANTVLGTPYYISPEICEGKPYNEKSDIWSLGCILYEMACLQKTFEGTNLPALVNKIMKGHFTPVRGNYTQEFKLLVQDMLQREPEYRPSANELLFARLSVMVKRYMDPTTDVEEDLNNSKNSTNRKGKMRSVLYHIDTSESCMPPVPIKIDLPSIIKIRDVAVSSTHTLVLSCDGDVFSWGEGKKGQLGHGDLQLRAYPERVEALKGKSIKRLACGDSFSVFGSDNGIVMTCGDGSNGCLGQGDWSSASRPRLIESLLSVDVTALACGGSHVIAVGSDGEVFAWGKNDHGQLGLGDDENEENICEPQEVTVPESVFIQDVKCGIDGTMFLTDVGMLLACGNNEDNKLGLNNRQGFLMAMKNMFSKTEVEGRNVPTIIKPMATFRVLDMVLGPHHSAVVVESGLIYTFGRNSDGQLGMNNTKPRENPSQVKAMSDKIVHTAACGESFTVCGTEENNLYFWGKGLAPNDLASEESTKSSAECASLGIPVTNGHQRTPSIGSTGSTASCSAERKLSDDPSVSAGQSTISSRGIKSAPPCSRQARDDVMLSTSLDKSCPSNPVTVWSKDKIKKENEPEKEMHQSQETDGSASKRKPASSSMSQVSFESQLSLDGKSDIFLQPMVILQLSSNCFEPPCGNEENYELNLVEVMCQGNNLYLLVETSCPLPKRRSKRRKRMMMRRMSNQNLPLPKGTVQRSAHSNDGGDEYTSSETSELDTMGTIPTWIKNELTEAIPINDDNDADCSDEAGNGAITERQQVDVSVPETSSGQANGKHKEQNLASDINGNEVVNEEAKNKKDAMKEGDTKEKSYVVSSDSGMESYRGTGKGRGRGAQSAGYKAPKAGAVGAPRQLNRFRAGRGRSRQSSWTIEGAIREPTKKHGTKEKEDALSVEVKRLEQEKRDAEEQMKLLEEQHKQKLNDIEAAANLALQESEMAMKKEILNLKMELKNQSKQMTDNNQVMLQLQGQLVQLQSEQLRQSAREKRASSSLGKDTKKKGQQSSRLCTLS